MFIYGWKHQFGEPTVHALLAAESLHAAIAVPVTDPSLTGRDSTGRSVSYPVI